MQFSPRFSAAKGGHLSRVWNKILFTRAYLKHLYTLNAIVIKRHDSYLLSRYMNIIIIKCIVLFVVDF